MHFRPLAQWSVNSAIQLLGKFEWSSNRCSTENSTNMATPMDQDDPVGSSVAPSDSMSDILRAHKTTSSWKLFAGNHFTTLCHDRGCTPCATYMLHLTRGANARELGPQPEGLKHVLEEAWPGAIRRIRQDASQEVERANQTINRLEEELATIQKDGDNLFIRYEKECDRRHKVEDDVARYRARLRLREDSMRSSLSSTQPRAQSPSHLTPLVALPSTTPTTHAAGTPPRKKHATDSGTTDPTLDPYNPDNWEEGMYEEDWIGYNPPPPRPAGPLPPAQPIQADELHVPKYILLPKIIKPRLQASLPASVTGVLPRPLGKAPTRLAVRTHQWYDECEINDPLLEALYQEAKLLNGWDQNTTQRIAFQRITNHNHRLRKTLMFGFGAVT